MKTNQTMAFEKYVDLVFIVQNHLMFYIPKNNNKQINRFDIELEDYGDEQNIRYGMNIYLSKEIVSELDFDVAKSRYKDEMYKLASNWDIDATEMKKRKNMLEYRIISQAKLQYCFEELICDYSIKNIDLLALLTVFFSKLMKLKKEKQEFQHVKDFSRTNFYRYVKEAYLEEKGEDFKNLSTKNLLDLANAIFDLCLKEAFLFEYPEKRQYFDGSEEKFIELKEDVEQMLWSSIHQSNEEQINHI